VGHACIGEPVGLKKNNIKTIGDMATLVMRESSVMDDGRAISGFALEGFTTNERFD
jgi:hypothetical protein